MDDPIRDNLDLEYEEHDAMPVPGEQPIACGGIVVRGATADGTDGLTYPCVVIQMVLADGTLSPMYALVTDDKHMNNLPRLVTKAVRSAIKSANKPKGTP